MSTLSDFIARARYDLHELDANAELWTDEALTRHINHAVRELSERIPDQKKTTLTTTASSRDISISSLSNLINIEAVEWPTGEYPPNYVPYQVWGTTLTLLVDGAPSSVQNVNVYWNSHHQVDGGQSTLPSWAEDILVTGAVGYAAQAQSVNAIDRVNLGGDLVANKYRQFAESRLRAFRSALRTHGPRASLRTSSLYAPDEPIPSQDRDFGP